MLSRSALFVSSLALCAACGPLGSEPKDNSNASPTGTDMTPDPTSTGDMQQPNQLPQGTLEAPPVEGAADCALPLLPDLAALPLLETLPDPFTSLDGTRIASRDEWRCRRAEMASLVQQYELGPKPPKPESVSGALADNTFTVNVTDAGQTVSFNVTITLPTTGTAPYPAIVTLGNGTAFNDGGALTSLGVALIAYDNGDIGAQNGGSTRGQGKFYQLYPNHQAGAMMAWAWGVSRLIDALEATPAANINPQRVGVTGCSRNGKGALVIGAFDERIALTMPQESGAGGSASWRVSQAQQNAILAANPAATTNDQVQTLSSAAGEQPWFRSTFSSFGGQVNKLPIDQHMVMGLVAPRALYVADNTWQTWLGNESSFTSASTAHRIYEALGIPDMMGVTQIGDGSHCANVPPRQQAGAVNFVKRYLLDDASVNTTEVFTDGAFTVDMARWVPWETPVMQ